MQVVFILNLTIHIMHALIDCNISILLLDLVKELIEPI